MHEVLVTRLGGLSLPRKSVVRLTDRPDMFTVDVKQQCNNNATDIGYKLAGVQKCLTHWMKTSKKENMTLDDSLLILANK